MPAARASDDANRRRVEKFMVWASPQQMCECASLTVPPAAAATALAAVYGRLQDARQAREVRLLVDDRGLTAVGDRLPARQRVVARPEAAVVAEVEHAFGLAALDAQPNRQPDRDRTLFAGDAAHWPLAHELLCGRHAAVDADLEVAAEARARAGEVPHRLHVEAQATGEAIGLRTALHDQQLVLAQQIARGLEHVL